MKMFIHLLCFCCLCWVQSCGVVSLDEEMPGQLITINSSEYPGTEAQLMTALTNNSSKNWGTTGFTLQVLRNFQTCRMDDKLSLASDGTYAYDGGDLLCGAEDDQRLKTGTWEMAFEERRLTFDKGTSEEISLYVEEASDTKVIVSSTYMRLRVVGKYEVAL
ncbi:MAG: hypothetical protein RIG77_16660 [Cyclobacteriaceae bacterium]